MEPRTRESIGRLKRPAVVPPTKSGVPSKEMVEEVRSLFKRYAAEINANVELSQSSKTMYIDFASCFVRWMVGGFKPGSRGGRKPTSRVWPGRPLD
jgi:hypothetical protein